MNFKNLSIFGLKGKQLLIVIIVLVVFVLYKVILKKKNNNNNIEEIETLQKVLNYYGSHTCPHSRANSSMHNLITTNFKNKYPNIPINIYWSGEHEDMFTRDNVQYVPTITNSKKEHLFIGLPEGTKTDDKSDDELERILLENIYNQL